MQVHQSHRYSYFQRLLLPVLSAISFLLTATAIQAQTVTPKAPPAVGTIKAISSESLTLTTDSGTEMKVQIPAGIKVVQVPPGSKDLKGATPIQLTDLQPGDRVLVRTKPGDDAATLIALNIVAMKKTDLAAKQEKERAEWQRHGIGGLVSNVDPTQNAITIKTLTAGGPKDIVIKATQSTILRRYAPGSVNFDEAKVAPITDIKPGDQLRARGTRNADGAEFAADEIVTGSFRNIAGVVTAVNATTGTLTLNELATKKLVELKVTPESQMRKLPQQMATGIAMRLKGAGTAGGTGSQGQGGQPAGGAAPAQTPSGQTPSQGHSQGQAATGGDAAAAQRRQGGGDMNQLLSRLPASPLTDFVKGDAVMVVATAGQGDAPSTVITLLGGVEPILQATSQGQAASILTPWSLGQGGGGDAGTP
ncbi:MAG TPA: hypothetical protein VMH89_14635 [Candidatus Acidoferrum sp.]|nr:hypothetical protein [Candidatus Acidoferrum sp.]